MKKYIKTTLFKAYLLLRELRHSVLISIFGFSFTCKHKKSCSRNLVDKIKEEGLLKGSYLGVSRILTCFGR